MPNQLSFNAIPEPEINLQVPSTGTILWHLWKLLLQGDEVPSPLLERNTGSWRAAAYAHLLKKMGWPVLSKEIVCHADTKPKTRYIASYFLDKKFIEKFRQISGDVRYDLRNQ